MCDDELYMQTSNKRLLCSVHMSLLAFEHGLSKLKVIIRCFEYKINAQNNITFRNSVVTVYFDYFADCTILRTDILKT